MHQLHSANQTVQTSREMWSQVLSLLLLASISSAYRQHAYSTKVKHIIPIKQDLTENQQDIPIIVVEDEEPTSQKPKETEQPPLEKEAAEQEADQKENSLEDEDQSSHFYQSHYPKYRYEYGVKDYHTGDHKSQWEIRDGDVVKGEYTLFQPDGTQRVVRYKADDANGFQAEVKNVGKAIEQTDEKDATEEIDVRSFHSREEPLEEDQSDSSDGGIAYSYNKLRQYL